MQFALSRQTENIGRIEIIQASDLAHYKDELPAEVRSRKYFCPFCGSAVFLNNGKPTQKKNSRPHPRFTHCMTTALSAVCEDNDKQVSSKDELLKAEVRMPLFLRQLHKGEFSLAVGFSPSSWIAFSHLQREGFGEIACSTPTGADLALRLAAFDPMGKYTFMAMPEAIPKNSSYSLSVREFGFNPDVKELADSIPGWHNTVDFFGSANCVGAVFEAGNESACKKVQTGAVIFSETPYLIAEKDTIAGQASWMSGKLYLDMLYDKGIVSHYERIGNMSLGRNRSQTPYAVSRIVFPSSKDVSIDDYRMLIEKLSTDFGVHLVDAVEDAADAMAPAV